MELAPVIRSRGISKVAQATGVPWESLRSWIGGRCRSLHTAHIATLAKYLGYEFRLTLIKLDKE